MTWLEIEVFTTPNGIELLCLALEKIGFGDAAGGGGFLIKNPQDFEEFLEGKQGRWDLVDESLFHLRQGESSVTFYLPGQQSARMAEVDTTLANLRLADSAREFGRLEYDRINRLEEEHWQESWKQYWKPTKIGRRVVVCPSWEEYHPASGEQVVFLDPGMAFGTGTHESTRLCIQLAENAISSGERVLDLGCGSGILAITALMLGAGFALGIDIDPMALEVCAENARLNGLEDKAVFREGKLGVGVAEKYDIVFANIVADVILELIPDLPRLLAPGGVAILSGILAERVGEVLAALAAAGITVQDRVESEGWAAVKAVLNCQPPTV